MVIAFLKWASESCTVRHHDFDVGFQSISHVYKEVFLSTMHWQFDFGITPRLCSTALCTLHSCFGTIQTRKVS